MKRMISFFKSIVILLAINTSVCYGQAFSIPAGGTTGPSSPVPITVDGAPGFQPIYIGKGVSNFGASFRTESTAIGVGALQNNDQGLSNTALGFLGLNANKGNWNTAIGANSIMSINNLNANGNTGVGYNTLSLLINSQNNTAVGFRALQSVTTGSNTAVGASALSTISDITSQSNTAFGFSSLSLLSLGSHNAAFGGGSMLNWTTGNLNTAIGQGALSSGGPGGNNNVAVGALALTSLTNGSSNVALGASAQAPTSTGNISNSLSIQNVIYGVNMTSAAAASTSIGVTGGPTPYVGTTYSKLHVGGSPSPLMPSLQLDYVPTLANTTNNYLYVDAATGIVRQGVPTAATGINTCSWLNYLPKTNNVNGNMICSQVYDNGTNVGIGVGATPSVRLDVECGGGRIKLRNLQAYTSSTELKTLIIDPITFEVWMGSSSNNRQSNTCSLDCDAIDNAIKSQQAQIDEQKIQIANQQAEINELKNKINQLVPGNVIVKDDNFQITPNPVTGTSTVSYKMDASITNVVFIVYDLQGKLLKKYAVDKNAKQGQVQISKKDFGNGMYILSLVSNGEEIQSKKFLIAD